MTSFNKYAHAHKNFSERPACMLRHLFSPSFSALQRGGRGWNGTRRASCNALIYEAFGQPEKVVKLVWSRDAFEAITENTPNLD